MSDLLQVELVAADRLVWSGEAKMVIARTTEGDVGILPGHAPLLSLLVHGVVDVQTTEGETWIADSRRLDEQARHGSHLRSQQADDRGLH